MHRIGDSSTYIVSACRSAIGSYGGALKADQCNTARVMALQAGSSQAEWSA